MTTLVSSVPAPGSAQARKSPYIASPTYDWVFFLLPPIVSLILGAAISETNFANDIFWVRNQRNTWASLLIGIFIHAHLVAVFVRSHLNPNVFPQHKFRFIVVPIALIIAMMTSMWAVVFATVLVTFWDVWHSALQTFGLGRIYDRNHGNDPLVGRRLDLLLNLLLYIGPIVSGATMYAHFQKFELFADIELLFFTRVPVAMTDHQGLIARISVVGGAIFLLFYVLAYFRLARRGYKVCGQKVFLYVTTGICSIWAWGFNAFGQAFLIMNLFHAFQYFGLVWFFERRVFMKRLRLDGLRFAAPLALGILLVFTFGYGAIAEIFANEDRFLWSIVQTVALMHFFYDGFIWSVRKSQV